ncbi:unnamed protein product [Alopecurus aequalis]
MERACAINVNFMHELENNKEFSSLHGLFTWMHNYFRSCPDSLKACIVYLSIFPRDHICRRRRLVRRWIAEGYSRDNYEESAENIGEKQFSDLLDLSIIQQSQEREAIGDTRTVLCQVNGFISEYIVKWRIEENLVFELGRSSNLTTERTGHHLVILEHWRRDKIVFGSINFSQLQSLTVFGKWESYFISERMKLLRVLDLEDASGPVEYRDLQKMAKWLRHLKFLSLRGQHEIHCLPSLLDNLRELESLDVRNTSIVTLPKDITKLKKLQYIRAGTTDILASAVPGRTSSSWFRKHRSLVGVEMPRGIGKLTVLHTLGVVNVAASGSKNFVKDLKKLTQLRKLGVCGINSKNSKHFFSAIQCHAHLESLSVRLDKEEIGCFLKEDNGNKDLLDGIISLACENVMSSLKLYGLENNLPNIGATQYRNLTKFELEMTRLTYIGTRIIGKLPKLSILRVNLIQDGNLDFTIKVNNEEDHSYKKLKVLEIGCMSSKLSVTFGAKTMKKLKLLKVGCLNASSTFKFTGMTNLKELNEVVLVNGPNAEKLKEYLDHQLAGHPTEHKKPVVKLVEPPRSS